ncbi:unnamed protein product [Vicia faba]|uniref:SWIM-type domain-containing protein n=1 Tax=Vicia faba TaxID=3906 RepID=A0AAV0Z9U6_VICFA|nr:unnamed protein product [Vicia faba]
MREDIDFPVEIDSHVLADVDYRDFTTPRMLLFRCQGKYLSWCREHGFQFLYSLGAKSYSLGLSIVLLLMPSSKALGLNDYAFPLALERRESSVNASSAPRNCLRSKLDYGEFFFQHLPLLAIPLTPAKLAIGLRLRDGSLIVACRNDCTGTSAKGQALDLPCRHYLRIIFPWPHVYWYTEMEQSRITTGFHSYLILLPNHIYFSTSACSDNITCGSARTLERRISKPFFMSMSQPSRFKEQRSLECRLRSLCRSKRRKRVVIGFDWRQIPDSSFREK